MNYPNLPFDNLYKFLALFGLVLIGYGVFFINSSAENIYREAFTLDERTDYYNSKITLNNDTLRNIEHLKDSISIANDIKYFEHRLESLPRKITIFVILLLLGGILSWSGFYYWYYKYQQYQDRIIKNEALKYSNEHWAYINKTKFDKEQVIYENLWRDLVVLRNETLNLRSDIDEYKNVPLSNETIHSRSKAFFEAHKNCNKMFELNKPFYSEAVYKSVDNVLTLCQTEYASFAMGGFSNLEDYWRKSRENSRAIVSAIDCVAKSIRVRLENVEINTKSS